LSYFIKEIFYSVQGEGFYTGRPAVFCRFAGCNLWSGRESDRSKAICRFCDTDFVGCNGEGGGEYRSAEEGAHQIEKRWPERKKKSARPFVVCTGGEPLLQLDEEFISALRAKGFEIAVETNGTILPPSGIDWICVSPKAGTDLLVQSGDELKLVYPQPEAEPERYEHLHFGHFFLQPLDSTDLKNNTRLALEYVLSHPQWRLSLQMHKRLGIP